MVGLTQQLVQIIEADEDRGEMSVLCLPPEWRVRIRLGVTVQS